MSIEIHIEDPLLARMLYLEAKRYGFDGDDGDILLLDPTLESVPEPAPGQLTVGLTASPKSVPDSEQEKLFALLALPFSTRELADTVRLFRRGDGHRIVRTANGLYCNGRKIVFSRTEGKLFDLLYGNRHRLVTEAEMNEVLGDSTSRTNTLAVYVYRLRRKLQKEGISCIRTMRGQGCQWIESRETV